MYVCTTDIHTYINKCTMYICMHPLHSNIVFIDIIAIAIAVPIIVYVDIESLVFLFRAVWSFVSRFKIL